MREDEAALQGGELAVGHGEPRRNPVRPADSIMPFLAASSCQARALLVTLLVSLDGTVGLRSGTRAGGRAPVTPVFPPRRACGRVFELRFCIMGISVT